MAVNDLMWHQGGADKSGGQGKNLPPRGL